MVVTSNGLQLAHRDFLLIYCLPKYLMARTKRKKKRKKNSLQADVGMFWSRFVYHLLKSGTKDASEREPRARFGSTVASCSSFIRLQSGDTRDRATDRQSG